MTVLLDKLLCDLEKITLGAANDPFVEIFFEVFLGMLDCLFVIFFVVLVPQILKIRIDW